MQADTSYCVDCVGRRVKPTAAAELAKLGQQFDLNGPNCDLDKALPSARSGSEGANPLRILRGLFKPYAARFASETATTQLMNLSSSRTSRPRLCG